MTENHKTLYLWDLAGTLFHEEWNIKKTGCATYDDWVEKQLGKPIDEVSAREYEEMYKIPYTEGWYFDTRLQPGFQEVLEWTKNNEIFTSGNVEQVDWRAEYLNPRVGLDVRKYFSKINTPFNYGETNIKTKEMMVDILENAYQRGFRAVVFTDDKIKYVEFFQAVVVELGDKYEDFTGRVYHILNNESGLQEKGKYFTIGNLKDFLQNEKKIKGEN